MWRSAPTTSANGTISDRGDDAGRDACLAQKAAVPDLDDQHEAGKRDRERGPDTSAHGFVVDEARPDRDEDRGDVLD